MSAKPRTKARRERRTEARRKLIRSALRLSGKRSFAELRIDEIAAKAGLSRTAFYTHFEDKEELLLTALEGRSADLSELATAWWEDYGPPAERVRGAVESFVSAYAEDPELLRVAVEVAAYDRDVARVWGRLSARFIDATADHVRAEQAGGLIPPSVDPDATAEALFWMTERCCQVRLGGGKKGSGQVIEMLIPVWTAALYPGVIPAGQLSPRLP